MAHFYLSPQRDQLLLMPVSMRDWLDQGHVAWFIIEVVGELDTAPLHTAVRAIGERANAELKERWKCIRRIRLCPNAISDIVAAAIVLSTLQRGNY